MITGGVPVLGVFSMANYFTFIPPGDSCGIILSMTPLQVTKIQTLNLILQWRSEGRPQRPPPPQIEKNPNLGIRKLLSFSTIFSKFSHNFFQIIKNFDIFCKMFSQILDQNSP